MPAPTPTISACRTLFGSTLDAILSERSQIEVMALVSMAEGDAASALTAALGDAIHLIWRDQVLRVLTDEGVIRDPDLDLVDAVPLPDESLAAAEKALAGKDRTTSSEVAAACGISSFRAVDILRKLGWKALGRKGGASSVWIRNA